MLPEGWKTEQLELCLEQIIDYRGKSTPKSDSGILLITARNVKDGYLDFSTREYMSEDDYTGWMTRGLPQGGDILFTTEAPLGSVAAFPNDGRTYALAQRLVTLRADQSKLDPTYLLYYLLSPMGQQEVDVRATGSTAKGIRQSELRKVLIVLPPLAEQCRIATILSAWDRAIDLTTQLIAAKQQRKRGLMQQLLTGQRRFAEFAGEEWQTKRLDQVFARVTRKNDTGNKNVLTASGQRGLVSQIEYFNRIVAGASLENYYLIKRGEFAYNRSSSEGYPFGAIKRLENSNEGVLSTLYLCFRLVDEECNGNFYKYFFEAGGLNLGIYSIAQEGARNHGLLNVGIDEFFSLDVPVPPVSEQNRLAVFFDTVDKDITLTIEKRKLLQQQKQGLMQQLLTGRVRVL